MGDVLLAPISIAALGQCATAFYEVSKHYQDANGKKLFYNERFYELGNVFVFHVSIGLWDMVGVSGEYPTMFVTAVGIAFGHLVHRLIICDVSKQRSRRVQYIIIPFVVVGILSVLES